MILKKLLLYSNLQYLTYSIKEADLKCFNDVDSNSS